MKIVKKVNKEYFELILKGIKKYELRLNDFECEPGDILVLVEKDPLSGELTGRKVEKKVTMVRKFKLEELSYKKEEIEDVGLQIISYK